ncbi:putative RNA-directed DNA polymerase [Tanacetum coccineum]
MGGGRVGGEEEYEVCGSGWGLGVEGRDWEWSERDREGGWEGVEWEGILLARETLPDMKDAFAIIFREESHRGIASSSSGSVGHTVDRCFDIIGYPPGFNKNIRLKSNGPRTFNANYVSSSSEKGASLSSTNEQMIKLMNLINKAPSGNVQANNSHPNGTLAKIKYVGNLKLSDKIVLYDVLVVPEYCDLHQNIIVGTGSENGGLYMFEYVSPLSSNSQTIGNLSAICFISKSMWHTRLGHPSDQAVNMLQQDLNFTKDSHVSPCDICHKAKQTREPFPFSDHQTTEIGELIHLDLWGPYKFKCNIKTVRYDNGSEFVNNKMAELFNSLGIIHQTSCAYTPQQNGIAERKHRHLLNVAKSLLLPSSVLNGKSSFELVYGFKLKLSHLRSFGCLCFSYVLNNSDKFSSKSEKYVLIGFSTTKKAYKVYSLESKMIYYSRDIKFYENIFPFKMNDSLQKDQSSFSESSDNNINGLNFFDEKHSDFQTSLSPNDDGRVYDTPHNDDNNHSCSSNADECENDFATSMGETYTSEGNVHNNSESPAQGNLPQNISQGQPDIRRSSRVPKMLSKFNDYVVNSSKNEPTSYFEAVKNPNRIEAMNNEIKALNRNNTWTVCDLPKGRKDVGSKWLWKIKYKSTGEIERYKARVVAKGFSQREGFDYLETFSLVAKMSTVRYVYMTLPPGFDTDKSKVCKLNKSLYGLKQAPRQWNAKLTQALTEHGFVQSKFDYSLFTKNSDNVFIILLVYVDDIVVTGTNVNEIEKFKQFLKSKFQIKDLGKLKYFMGIEVLDNKDGICLSQRKYCLELLHEFGLLAAKHVDTPLPENATLNHTESDDDHLPVNVSNYQRLVGSGIQINKTGNLKLRAYADSDWARCPATRKYVSAYCVFLGDSLVTWKSKKQSTLSKSSAEAEYRSMASATCEVIWLSNLLGDMGVKNLLPVVMYYDNSSTLQIAANPVFHEKSKHFEIDVHLVREKVSSGVIKIEKIHTTQQIADILTKGLDIEQHKILCGKLGMLDMFKLEKT